MLIRAQHANDQTAMIRVVARGGVIGPVLFALIVMLGVLVLGFTWALGHTLGPPHHGVALLAIFGVSSCILNGLLPCDAACAGESPVALAHNLIGIVGFLAAIAGMVVLARRWRDDPTWQHHAAPTIRIVVVALGGLAWFVATQSADPLHPMGGIAQRVFVGALLVWIARTAWLLDRHLNSVEPSPAAERSAADPGP